MTDVVYTSPEIEFADFMTSSPTLEEIAAYRLSDDSEARVGFLLEASRNGTLSESERAALDEYARLEHIMRMIKYRALEKLNLK